MSTFAPRAVPTAALTPLGGPTSVDSSPIRTAVPHDGTRDAAAVGRSPGRIGDEVRVCGHGAPRCETGCGPRPPQAASRPPDREETTMQGGWLEQFYRRVPPRPRWRPRPPRSRRRRETCPGGRSSRAVWPRASRPAWPPARCWPRPRSRRRRRPATRPSGPSGGRRDGARRTRLAASNWITPAKVLEAASSSRRGKIYKLGRVLRGGMPLFGARVVRAPYPGHADRRPVREEQARVPRRVPGHARSARSGPSSTGSATSAAVTGKTAT